VFEKTLVHIVHNDYVIVYCILYLDKFLVMVVILFFVVITCSVLLETCSIEYTI